MAKIRKEELDQLAGEVLPERTVLSAMPADPSGGAPFQYFCTPNNQGQTGSQNGNWFTDNINNPQCGLTNKSDNAAGGGLLRGLAS
jgi:hypothetical protein